jgi:hypothetical protein
MSYNVQMDGKGTPTILHVNLGLMLLIVHLLETLSAAFVTISR